MRAWFDRPLDTAATWWRIYRRDGVTLGFTTHDRDLWFGGIRHRAAPGMLPSAIRRSLALDDDESEVEGALAHDTVRAEDIVAGRFDEARIETGIVDWQTLEAASLYAGTIAAVTQDAGGFAAELASAKAQLDIDPVPRTSPTCRARFCGPGCNLSPAAHTRRAAVTGVDHQSGAVRLGIPDPAPFVHGTLRWIDGSATGTSVRIVARTGEWLLCDVPPPGDAAPGHRVVLREGCDKTIATCADRFGNAVNFQGEPHLPGTDLLARYPQPR